MSSPSATRKSTATWWQNPEVWSASQKWLCSWSIGGHYTTTGWVNDMDNRWCGQIPVYGLLYKYLLVFNGTLGQCWQISMVSGKMIMMIYKCHKVIYSVNLCVLSPNEQSRFTHHKERTSLLWVHSIYFHLNLHENDHVY